MLESQQIIENDYCLSVEDLRSALCSCKGSKFSTFQEIGSASKIDFAKVSENKKSRKNNHKQKSQLPAFN